MLCPGLQPFYQVLPALVLTATSHELWNTDLNDFTQVFGLSFYGLNPFMLFESNPQVLGSLIIS